MRLQIAVTSVILVTNNHEPIITAVVPLEL